MRLRTLSEYALKHILSTALTSILRIWMISFFSWRDWLWNRDLPMNITTHWKKIALIERHRLRDALAMIFREETRHLANRPRSLFLLA